LLLERHVRSFSYHGYYNSTAGRFIAELVLITGRAAVFPAAADYQHELKAYTAAQQQYAAAGSAR
jgi:hypothetical protein